MAEEYVIEKATLTAIADSIRAKKGTTADIVPENMPEEIASIEGGGGSGTIEPLTVTENGTYTPPEGVDGYSPVSVMVAPPASNIDALIDGSITEITSNAEEIRGYAFQGCLNLITADFPEATSIGDNAFYNCRLLTTANFPKATKVGSAFGSCSTLTIINLPSATSIAGSAFNGCNGLTAVKFPNVTSIRNGTFNNCQRLVTADYGKATTIERNAFQWCYALTHLIVRTETLCTLSSAIEIDSKIAKGEGYIYVPSALIEDYKAATNWSTYADQFRALEDYTVDGTITGEIDKTKI